MLVSLHLNKVFHRLFAVIIVPREEQNSSEAHLTVKKLFVAGLREGIDEESLRQHFSRFGNILEVLVMKDRDGKWKD